MTDRSQVLLQLLMNLELLCRESILMHDAEQVQPMFEVMVRALENLRQRTEVATQSSYRVAIVGLTNVGKSTLFNALLGDDLAPSGNGPCTAVPIEFVHGKKLRVTATISGMFQKRRWHPATAQELQQVLRTLAHDPGGTQKQALQRIEVQVPNPLLEDKLTLVDTPGFGAAQAGEAAGSHEEALREYLRQEVAQVFWIVRADVGIGKKELDFYHHWFADNCDDLVVTGCEDWDPADRERFRRHYSSKFGLSMPPQFHFVSGLRGSQAQKDGQVEDWEAAGIPVLEQRIRELSHPEGRITAIQIQLEHLVADFAAWLWAYRDHKGRPLNAWWPEFKWSQFEQFIETEAMDFRPLRDTLLQHDPQRENAL